MEQGDFRLLGFIQYAQLTRYRRPLSLDNLASGPQHKRGTLFSVFALLRPRDSPCLRYTMYFVNFYATRRTVLPSPRRRMRLWLHESLQQSFAT